MLGPLRFWPAHVEWRENADFEAALADARLVVINGEGTIHHDRLAGWILLQAGERARQASVPVALINTGWEANGAEFVKMLNNFDLLAARDSRSATRMAAGGADVRIVPDLSIWHARAHTPQPNAVERAGIGFTDNVDRFKALSLERLRRTCGGETLTIGHSMCGCRGWGGFLRDGIGLREDIRHPMRLARLLVLRHRLWLEAESNSDGFLERISRLDLLVSGRFHACTFAISTGTPVIAQSSNTGKIAALFHDAGLEPWRSDFLLEPEAVEEARDYGWSKAEHEALDTYLATAMNEAEKLFVDLARLASR